MQTLTSDEKLHILSGSRDYTFIVGEVIDDRANGALTRVYASAKTNADATEFVKGSYSIFDDLSNPETSVVLMQTLTSDEKLHILSADTSYTCLSGQATNPRGKVVVRTTFTAKVNKEGTSFVKGTFVFDNVVSIDNGADIHLHRGTNEPTVVTKYVNSGGVELDPSRVLVSLGNMTLPDGSKISIRLEETKGESGTYVRMVSDINLSNPHPSTNIRIIGEDGKVASLALRSLGLTAEAVDGNVIGVTLNSGKTTVVFEADGSITTLSSMKDTAGRELLKGANISLLGYDPSSNSYTINRADLWAGDEQGPNESMALRVGNYRNLKTEDVPTHTGTDAAQRQTMYDNETGNMWGMIHISGGEVVLYSTQILYIRNSGLSGTEATSNTWAIVKVSDMPSDLTKEVGTYLAATIKREPATINGQPGEVETIDITGVYQDGKLLTFNETEFRSIDWNNVTDWNFNPLSEGFWAWEGNLYNDLPNKEHTHAVTFTITIYRGNITFGRHTSNNAEITNISASGKLKELVGGWWSSKLDNGKAAASVISLITSTQEDGIAAGYGFKEGITFTLDDQRFTATLSALRTDDYLNPDLRHAFSVEDKHLWIEGVDRASVRITELVGGYIYTDFPGANNNPDVYNFMREYGYIQGWVKPGFDKNNDQVFQVNITKKIDALLNAKAEVASLPEGTQRNQAQAIVNNMETRLVRDVEHHRLEDEEGARVAFTTELDAIQGEHDSTKSLILNHPNLDSSIRDTLLLTNKTIGTRSGLNQFLHGWKAWGSDIKTGAGNLAANISDTIDYYREDIVNLVVIAPPAQVALIAQNLATWASAAAHTSLIATGAAIYVESIPAISKLSSVAYWAVAGPGYIAAEAISVAGLLYAGYWTTACTLSAINVSLYAFRSAYNNESITAEGFKDCIDKALVYAVFFAPFRLLGTGSSFMDASANSSVKWVGEGARSWSPFAVQTAAGTFRSGWAMLGWSTAVLTGFDYMHSTVVEHNAHSLNTLLDSFRKGLLGAMLFAAGSTLASGYRNLATQNLSKIPTRPLSEPSLESGALEHWRVSFAFKGGKSFLASTRNLLLWNPATHTISAGLFGAIGFGAGLGYYLYTNSGYEDVISNFGWKAVGAGIAGAFVAIGLAAVIVNLIPTAVRTAVSLNYKPISKVTHTEIIGQTPGALGLTGVGNFFGALANPTTSNTAFNMLWGQGFGIGSHMIMFTGGGKVIGVAVKGIREGLGERLGWHPQGKFGLALGWMARQIEHFGRQGYIDSFTRGFIFGLMLAPFGAAMAVSEGAFSALLNKIKLTALSDWIVKEGSMVKEWFVAYLREGYVEGSVSALLQSIGVPIEAAETIVELIPGMSPGAVNMNFARVDANLYKTLQKAGLRTGNKQAQIVHVADAAKTDGAREKLVERLNVIGISVTASELADPTLTFQDLMTRANPNMVSWTDAAILLHEMGTDLTPAQLNNMSYEQLLSYMLTTDAKSLTALSLLCTAYELSNGEALTVDGFADITGQTHQDLEQKYNLSFTATRNTLVLRLKDYLRLDEVLNSQAIDSSIKTKVQQAIDLNPNLNASSSIKELLSSLSEAEAVVIADALKDVTYGELVADRTDYSPDGLAAERGFRCTDSYVGSKMSIDVFMEESGARTERDALMRLGFSAVLADIFMQKHKTVKSLSIAQAAKFLVQSELSGYNSIAEVLLALEANHDFKLRKEAVRDIESLAHLAQQSGLSITELLELSGVTTVSELAKFVNMNTNTLKKLIRHGRNRGKLSSRAKGTKLTDLDKISLERIGKIKLDQLNQTQLNQEETLLDEILRNLNIEKVKVVVAKVERGVIDLNGELYTLRDTQIAHLEEQLREQMNNPYVDFVLELNDGTRINLHNVRLSINTLNGSPVLCVTLTNHEGIQTFVDFDGNNVGGNVKAEALGYTFGVPEYATTITEDMFEEVEVFDIKTHKAKKVWRFKEESLKIPVKDADENEVDINDPAHEKARQTLKALYQTMSEMYTNAKNANENVEFTLRDQISPVQAILQVAFVENTFFEIPTGFGKTQAVFKGLARLNSLLKERGVLENRHSIYITHNSTEFIDNAKRSNKMNEFFRSHGMNIISLCQNGVLADEDYDGKDQWDLDHIKRDPEGLIKRLKENNGADVIYMDADTFRFLHLGLVRNADHQHADILNQLNTQIFANAKVIHDEVDTAFFANRAQEGMDARPLTGLEIKYLRKVNEFMNSLDELKGKRGKAYAEAQRELLKFKFQIDQNTKDWTYQQWLDNGKRTDYIVVYFNKSVHERFMKFVEEETGLNFHGNLKAFYNSENEEVKAYRASLVGRTNCLTQYVGGDIALDPKSQLIKPAPQGVLAPQLQLSDPYFAGHTELVFKQVLEQDAYLEDTMTEHGRRKGLRLSNLATVTSMAAAMTSAIHAGADFGGFSGTLSSVKDLAKLLFGISVDTSMGSSLAPFNYKARIDSLFKVHDWQLASTEIAAYVQEHNIPYIMFMDGATLHDDNPLPTIRTFLEANRTVIHKQRGGGYLLYTPLRGYENPVKIDLKSDLDNGKIGVQKFMSGLTKATQPNSDYTQEFTQLLMNLGLTESEAQEVIEQNSLVFYLNAPATRATDIELTELKSILKSNSGSQVECFGIIDGGTASWFFKQLAGRDRGYRYIEDRADGKYKEESVKDLKDENTNRQYHKLHVYMIDSQVDTIEQVAKNSASKRAEVLQEFFKPIDKLALEKARFNAISELIDIRGAEFLSSLKRFETERGRIVLHELITMYQSFLEQNDKLNPEGRAKDSIEALQERINSFMEFVQDFKDNNKKEFNRLSKTTQDAINAELEIFAKGDMDLHLALTRNDLSSKTGEVAFSKAMSILIARINANVSVDMLPETPPMAGMAQGAKVETEKQDVENTARETTPLDTFKRECQERGWYDAETGQYSREAALAARYSKNMQKLKTSKVLSMIIAMILQGGRRLGDDDDDQVFYDALTLMERGYLSAVKDNFNALESRINFIEGLIQKNALTMEEAAEMDIVNGIREHASKVEFAETVSSKLKFLSHERRALKRYIAMQQASYMIKLNKFRENYKIEPWLGLPTRKLGVRTPERIRKGLRLPEKDDSRIGLPAPIVASVLLGSALGPIFQVFFISFYAMIGGGFLPDLSVVLSKLSNRLRQVYYGMRTGWHSNRMITNIDKIVRKEFDTEAGEYSAKFLLSLVRPGMHQLSIDYAIDAHLAYRRLLEISGENFKIKAISVADDIRPAIDTIRSLIRTEADELKSDQEYAPYSLNNIIFLIKERKLDISKESIERISPYLKQVPMIVVAQRGKDAAREGKFSSKAIYYLDPSKFKLSLISGIWGYIRSVEQRISNAQIAINYDEDVPAPLKKKLNNAASTKEHYWQTAKATLELNSLRREFNKADTQIQRNSAKRRLIDSAIKNISLSNEDVAELLIRGLLDEADADGIKDKAKDALREQGIKNPTEKQVDRKVLSLIYSSDEYTYYLDDIRLRTSLNADKIRELAEAIQDKEVSEYKGLTITKTQDGSIRCIVEPDSKPQAKALANVLNDVIDILQARGEAGEEIARLIQEHPEYKEPLDKIKQLINDSTLGKGEDAVVRVRETLGGANAQRTTSHKNQKQIPVIELEEAFVEFVTTAAKTYRKGAAWIMLERFGHELCHTDINLDDNAKDAAWQIAEEYNNKRNFDYPIMQILDELGTVKSEINEIFTQYGEMKEFVSSHFYRGVITRKEAGVRVVVPEDEIEDVLWSESLARMIKQSKDKEVRKSRPDYIETLEALQGNKDLPETIRTFLLRRRNESLQSVREELYYILSGEKTEGDLASERLLQSLRGEIPKTKQPIVTDTIRSLVPVKLPGEEERTPIQQAQDNVVNRMAAEAKAKASDSKSSSAGTTGPVERLFTAPLNLVNTAISAIKAPIQAIVNKPEEMDILYLDAKIVTGPLADGIAAQQKRNESLQVIVYGKNAAIAQKTLRDHDVVRANINLKADYRSLTVIQGSDSVGLPINFDKVKTQRKLRVTFEDNVSITAILVLSVLGASSLTDIKSILNRHGVFVDIYQIDENNPDGVSSITVGPVSDESDEALNRFLREQIVQQAA